jgi:regulator of cell morphogenesis and NO signaling
MNSPLPETVGEIAAQFPASIGVFERYGIDYCCAGSRPLEEACRRQGADPAAVLEDVRQALLGPTPGAEIDWRSAGLGELIDHILTTHHAYLKRQLPRLENMLAKTLSQHAARHGEVLQPLAEIFRGMRQELDAHLMKEEAILFPLIRNPGASHCGSIQNPIRVMLAEHDSAGQALAGMRRLTAQYQVPADACNTFRSLYLELAELEADLHRHIHLENHILFPRAIEAE